MERGIRPALCRRRPGRGRTCARVSQSRSPSRKRTCDASNNTAILTAGRAYRRAGLLQELRRVFGGRGRPCEGRARAVAGVGPGAPPPLPPFTPPPPPAGPRFALPPSASRSRGGVGCWPGSLVPSPASSPPAPPPGRQPRTQGIVCAPRAVGGVGGRYEHMSRIPSPPFTLPAGPGLLRTFDLNNLYKGGRFACFEEKDRNSSRSLIAHLAEVLCQRPAWLTAASAVAGGHPAGPCGPLLGGAAPAPGLFLRHRLSPPKPRP